MNMKELSLCCFATVLLASSVRAQIGFEGKIKYTTKILSENINQEVASIPKSYEYIFSDSSMLIKMYYGKTDSTTVDFLKRGDENESYLIDHSKRTTYKIPDEEKEKADDQKPPTVDEQNEVIEIAGYSCKKLKVITPVSEGKDYIQYFWVTKDIKIEHPKKTKVPGGGNLFVEGFDGFPLKVMTETMGMTMIMTATEANESKVDKGEFEIPKNYEIKDFDPSMFGHNGY